jgi:NlpC/P60 family
MTLRDDIVVCARRYINVRFSHQGRGADGLDCLGLLLVTAADCGCLFEGLEVTNMDVPTYGARPDTALLKQKLDQFLVPISSTELLYGDIVLLKVNGSPQHLAIICDYPMVGELGIIHAYAPARKVVEHRYDAAWRRDTYAAYRLPQFS